MPLKLIKTWIDILHPFGKAWWVEISTDFPNVIYYFGPFNGLIEAESSAPGYIQDLQEESAQGIQMNCKYCRPTKLTIDQETDSEHNSLSLTTP